MSYGYVFPSAVPFVSSGRGNGMEDLAKPPGSLPVTMLRDRGQSRQELC